jgi:hypothetical protein
MRQGIWRTASLTVASALLGTAWAARGADSPSASSATEIVLGSKNFIPPYHGLGWGTAHPRRISNGGVPGGNAFRIHWRTWGGLVARGRGLTWIYNPRGGYYSKAGAIELRAYGIGWRSSSSDAQNVLWPY